jgi:anti-anti-sigma factor
LHNDAATVRLIGELDVDTARVVHDALDMLCAAGCHNVTVDLDALSFCDCAGLRAFLAGTALLHDADGRLTLTSPTDQIAACSASRS